MRRVMLVFIFFVGILVFPTISFSYSNPFDLPDSWTWDDGEFYGEGDPYILKHNGTYYLYVSTVDDKSGVKAWTSEDLMNWDYAGLVTEEPSTKAAYAPEVTYWNGAFYMYTSPGGDGHYVYKSTSPLGPFEKQTENLGAGIDGHVFIDDDGQWYFYGTGSGYISAHEMEDPYTFGPELNTGAEMNGWTEAATVIKRNGKYYLTYAGNHVWSNAYRINYAVSDSPTGDFESADAQNPLLLNTEGLNVGLGHNGIVEGPDLDSELIVYHSHAKPGRVINMDRIGWNGDKMVVLGPTIFEQQNPNMPDFSERFNRENIGSDWSTVNGGDWSIVNSNDDYALQQETIDESTWQRQITEFTTGSDYIAEFNMSMIEKGDSENPQLGSVFSYQDENNYGLAVLNPNKNELETTFVVDGVEQEWESSELPDEYDYEELHQIRVEKQDETFKIYVDGMHKQTRNINGLEGGMIGYTTTDVSASFGYIATSNQVNGSNIFELNKPLPGTIEAVHYNSGGEGEGYHSSKNEVNDTFRNDEVNIESNPEGGYSVNEFSADEWLNYNVNIEEDGIYDFNIRMATPKDGTKVRLWLDDEIDLTGIVSAPNTGGWDQWQSFLIDNIELPEGEHKITVEVVEAALNFANFDVNKHKDVSTFFDDFNDGLDTEWTRYEGNWKVDTDTDEVSVFDVYKPLPGSFDAAHYITGGEGIAYHDTTIENIGGALRDDSVDIRNKPGGGTAVGWNQTGEWLKYNVDIQEEGIYNIEIELATTFTDAEVRLWLNDETDLTGIVDVPNTGGFNDWQTLTIEDVHLPKGEHTLKIETVTGEFDFSTLSFRSFDIYKPLPGTIEAEDYNLGGEGVAYHDNTETNTGGEFRNDGVDITLDPNGGFAVESFEQEEWINYNVNVSESGEYDLDLIAANSDKNTEVKLLLIDGEDETDLTDVVEIPVTEGKDDFMRVPIKGIELPKGKHTLKIEVINGEMSFSKMIFHTFDEHHTLPGEVMAVDYITGGEGVAYHSNTDEIIGGEYRYDAVNIRNHPDGTFALRENLAGEWYKYNVAIQDSGEYTLEMNITNDVEGSQARVWLNDEVDLTGIIDIPQTNGMDNWTSVITEDISLPEGEHTIKVEIVDGEFDFHNFNFHDSDEFEVIEQDGFYRSDAESFGKSVTGESAWNNYIVEADVQVVNGEGDGGILFRVNNPVHGTELNHNSPDMLQGYVAYINNDGVHLGKFNYDWEYLTGASLNNPIDEWQHIKVEANGTNIKVFVDDMERPKINYTDHSQTAFTHGKVGVRSFHSDTKYDNYLVRAIDSGSAILTKKGEDGELLEGVVFELQDEDSNKIREYTTDEKGQIIIDSLQPGKYQFQEVETIPGYGLNTDVKEFEIGKTQDEAVEIAYVNDLKTGSVELIKTGDGEALEDATYSLLDADGNQLEKELKTDDKGKIKVTNLKPGHYQFVETKAPFGYSLDKTPLDFEIEFDQEEMLTITSESSLVTSEVKLIVTGEDDELIEGAVFELQNSEGDTIEKGLESNEDGIIVVKDLTPGTYQFVETETVAGYDLDPTPISFEIEFGQTEQTEIEFVGDLTTGTVELEVVDEEGRTLQGAEFKLVDEKGNELKSNLTTDANGKIIVTDLKPGHYKFIEIQAPSGYELDEKEIDFTISKGETDTVEVNVVNEKSSEVEKPNDPGAIDDDDNEETQQPGETESGDGGSLPSTATNIFNLTLIGLGFLLMGMILLYLKRRIS